MFPRRIEVFIALAVLAHGVLFSAINIAAGSFKRQPENPQLIPIENVPPEVQTALDESQKRRRTGKTRVKPVAIATPEVMIVIPIPKDNQPRWIVDLLDIPDEEEPDNARFVSERPSKVEEEVQAEITAREPRKRPRKRSENSPRISAAARPGETAQSRPARAARMSRRGGSRAAPTPPAQIASRAENSSAAESPRSEIPESENGALPASETPGETTATREQRPPKKIALLPTYSELAHEQPPANGETGIPGEHPPVIPPTRKAPGISHEEQGVPGVAEAPENFVPFVKKRGSITLLNAKSYKFSSFVRRVARRMFDRFVAGFHPEAYFGANWSRIENGASIEAVMNRNGRLVNLSVNRNTGNAKFDALASNSARQEAWDSNVPKGAECSDGFIHFIFMPRVIPSEPVDSPNGRVYNSYLIIAIAGLQDCD